MNLIVIIISGLLIGFATSYFAQKRGRDGASWFMIGVLLGIFGLLLLFLLPSIGVGSASKRPATMPTSQGNSFEGWGGQPADRADSIAASDANKEPLSKALAEAREKDWYYVDAQRQQQGPILYEDLRLAFQREHLSRESLVWCEGMDAWQPLHMLSEVYADLSPVLDG